MEPDILHNPWEGIEYRPFNKTYAVYANKVAAISAPPSDRNNVCEKRCATTDSLLRYTNTDSLVSTIVNSAQEVAGLPSDIVLYSARHSFATDMLDGTGNIVLVRKMLGHQSVTTTQRHLHPDLKGNCRTRQSTRR
jgi:integrase